MIRYCDACGVRLDEPYILTPAANGVGEPTAECMRHFPLEDACLMVEESFGLPVGFLADAGPEVARALRDLAGAAA